MHNLRKHLIFWFTITIMSIAGTQTALAKDPINTNWRGLAVKGYDVVAYFTMGKPVKGNKSFTYEWKGARWRFSSRQHLEAFKEDPQRYAPQYGGY